MTLEHNTAVVAQGLALPIYDLRQPLFSALLGTYLAQVQLLEDSAWDVYIGTMLPAASGDALDMIGELVGEARKGRDDALYRLWIAARVRLSTSSGRPRDIYAIIRAVVPASMPISLSEYFPGDFMIDLLGAVDGQMALEIATILHESNAAGVRVEVLLALSPPGETFTLTDTSAAPDIDPMRGLADTAQTSGGKLVGVL